MHFVEGLADGTIDAVATDHAPHSLEDKDCEWAAAAMGMVGLETAVGVVAAAMVETGLLDWAGVADRMSVRPARIGRLAGHGRPIAAGEPANLVLVDPDDPLHRRRHGPGVAEPQQSVRRHRADGASGRHVPARAAHRS